jgi:hypothetical protein
MTLITSSPTLSPPPTQAPRRIVPKATSSPWVWMIATCLLLGISGGIRYWRASEFDALIEASLSPPFKLEGLPRTLGDWQSVKENDDQLDPEVSRIAGSTDHIVRTYVDRKSGERISTLAIYGLANQVHLHTPDACYPATGHQLVRGPVDRELRVPGVEVPIHYRWAVYMKRIGGVGHYVEAYHCFLYDNEWMPNASHKWKSFRYRPGMFKIQLARELSSISDEVHGPSEALLGSFIREISDRELRDRTGGTPEPTPVPAASAPDSAKPERSGSD